jgi:hypothetical protein
VCVVLCAVFRFMVVLFCVMCVICLLCLIVLPLPPGKNPFEVKINKLLVYYTSAFFEPKDGGFSFERLLNFTRLYGVLSQMIMIFSFNERYFQYQ